MHPCQRRGVPRTGDRPEHAAGEQQRHEHRHREVAGPAAAERVDDGGCTGPGQQDAERQGGDPPRHERRALARVVGDLGRLGDVGHLEAPVGGRGEQEGHRDPSRREPGRRARAGEDQHEQRRQREAAGEHPRPARTPAALRAVRPAADPRVEHDVPGLGREHHQPGETGGDAELVGQVVEQQQAGHRAERRGPDRAQRVAQVGSAGQPRSRRNGGHKIGTVLLSRP